MYAAVSIINERDIIHIGSLAEANHVHVCEYSGNVFAYISTFCVCPLHACASAV